MLNCYIVCGFSVDLIVYDLVCDSVMLFGFNLRLWKYSDLSVVVIVQYFTKIAKGFTLDFVFGVV